MLLHGSCRRACKVSAMLATVGADQPRDRLASVFFKPINRRYRPSQRFRQAAHRRILRPMISHKNATLGGLLVAVLCSSVVAPRRTSRDERASGRSGAVQKEATIKAMRRFCWRPVSVALSAMGLA